MAQQRSLRWGQHHKHLGREKFGASNTIGAKMSGRCSAIPGATMGPRLAVTVGAGSGSAAVKGFLAGAASTTGVAATTTDFSTTSRGGSNQRRNDRCNRSNGCTATHREAPRQMAGAGVGEAITGATTTGATGTR